jgi:hypothetical protein
MKIPRCELNYSFLLRNNAAKDTIYGIKLQIDYIWTQFEICSTLLIPEPGSAVPFTKALKLRVSGVSVARQSLTTG